VVPRVAHHVAERVAGLPRGGERAGVVALGEQLAPSVQRAVDAAGDAHREPLHAARERGGAAGLDDEMDVVGQDRELDDGEPLAALGALHDAWLMRATQIPSGLLALWVVGVPPLFGLQIHSEWDRGRRLLQRAREELEERVVARTAELAFANASLREEIAERRAAEAALRESEERYRVVSELGSDLAFGFRIDLDDHMYDGWVTNAYTRITGYTLEELALRQATGATVLAIMRDGNPVVNPPGDLSLARGDRLLVLGTRDQLERVERVLVGKGS